LVRFRFVYSPEFVKINETMLIREGRTKIFGYITSIISEKQLELESTTKETK
jgi:GTPase